MGLKLINENEKKKVLLTFVGNTDPTRGNYDGPIIHICRHYKPEKIYLILTKEMQERDNKPYNIYEKAIKLNLKDYKPIIEKIATDIQEAHLFDSYFDVLYENFEKIKKEYPDAEVLVNLTSGTSQMTANLISYILDATNIDIKALQVSTPEKKSNTEQLVSKDYDVELEAEMNIDNEPDSENRVIEPDLKRYSRVLVKNQIKELLNQYEYRSIKELLKRDIFDKNLELNTLLNFAIDRKNLIGLKANEKLSAISNKEKKYDNLYYYKKDKNIKNVEEWYKIVDYFALANIKQESNDISGYILMLEPLTFNIYLSVFKDILKEKIENFFEKKETDYKVILNKLDNKLKKFIQKDSGIYLNKEGMFLSNKVLASVIKYVIKEKNKTSIDLNYFENFVETLGKVKNIRNTLAHTLNMISREDLKKEAGVEVTEINKKIIDFFNKFYKEFGYKNDMIDIYKNINKLILEILEQEN